MGGQIEGWIDTRWIQKGRCRTQGGWRPAAVVNIRAGARREYIIARARAYATCMNRFLVLNTVCMHAPLAVYAPLSMYTYAVCVSSVCMPRSLCVPMQYVHSHVFERGAGAGVARAIYVCIYRCVCVYIHVYIYRYVYICICILTYM